MFEFCLAVFTFFLSLFEVMEGFKFLKIGRPWNLLSKMSYAV
jgi:hypothetical protein